MSKRKYYCPECKKNQSVMPCDTCHGEGSLESGNDCPDCDASGFVCEECGTGVKMREDDAQEEFEAIE